MKEYKITYSGESEGYRLITDITEAAAKKYFREVAKETDMGRVVIESVELVSDKAMATKRNERDTLEAIRQMVADLGEHPAATIAELRAIITDKSRYILEPEAVAVLDAHIKAGYGGQIPDWR